MKFPYSITVEHSYNDNVVTSGVYRTEGVVATEAKMAAIRMARLANPGANRWTVVEAVPLESEKQILWQIVHDIEAGY